MISTDNLLLVKELFDGCIDLDPAQHEAYLLSTNCNDLKIIAEVRRLLSHSIDKTNTAINPQSMISQHIEELSNQIHKDQKLGIYEIDEEIGRGGMGIVFLAHRADGEYQQKVAIKILPSFAGAEELKRFHQERQILAQLQHPNIAMLLDGGSTPDKRLYLVMEYIQGQNIIEYCQQKKLGLKSRLHLFKSVCNAVEFAHSQLIIHRDIKPENIYVTAEGQVKLLDFGISKILNNNIEETQKTMMQGLTLAYASPEQVKGESTTTLTDVYGLGALLYTLLTNNTPHESSRNSGHLRDKNNPEEIIKSICQNDSKLVSKNVTLKHIPFEISKLKGDLDNITAKALRKTPNHRYVSVNELHQDIERFLNNETVLATPPTLSYKLKKQFKRHPLASGLALALFVSLCTGLIISLNLSQQLSEERDQLLQTQKKLTIEVNTSDQVINLLTDMFDQASPEKAQGKPIDIQHFVSSTIDKTKHSLNEKPLVKIKLLETLVNVSNKVGQLQKSIDLQLMINELEKKQYGLSEAKPSSMTKLGKLYYVAGQGKKSEEILLKAYKRLILQPRLLNEELALTCLSLSAFYLRVRDYDQALDFTNKGIKHYDISDKSKKLTGIELRFQKAAIFHQLERYIESVEILEVILEETIQSLGHREPFLIYILSDLGLNYALVDRSNDAKKVAEQAYTLAKEIIEPSANQYAQGIMRYTSLLEDSGEILLAKNILDTEISIEQPNIRNLAIYLDNRGSVLYTLGYYHKAKKDLMHALTLKRQHDKEGNSNNINLTKVYLGINTALAGDKKSGLQLLNEVNESNAKEKNTHSLAKASVLLLMSEIEIKYKNYPLAEKYLMQSHDIFSTKLSPEHTVFNNFFRLYTKLYLVQGKWLKAKNKAQQHLARLSETTDNSSPITAMIKSSLGEALWQLGEKKEARILINSSYQQLIKQLDDDSFYYQKAKKRIELMTP